MEPGHKRVLEPALRGMLIRWRREILAGTAVLVLSGLLLIGRAWAMKEVSVREGNRQPIVISTWGWTVGAALEQAGIQLREGDRVIPDAATRLRDGMAIRVLRGVPVHLRVDGQAVTVRTAVSTVGAFLTEAGIQLGPLDRVEPAPETPLRADLTIRVVRVAEHTESQRVQVPFPTRRQASSSLLRGQTRVVQEGKPGVAVKTFKVTYEDGKAVRRQLVQEQVVQPPVARIVAYGTKEPVRTVQTPSGPKAYRRLLSMEATAYAAKTADGRARYTATGRLARRGLVAVDPRVIPLGTRLYIPGYGEAVAADVGGAIKGMRIDLCFETRSEALRFGRRQVKVYVLSK